jgi:formate dehydrogenase maturation protein FdhE
MMERLLKKVGKGAAQDLMTQLNEKLEVKNEWHQFSCGANHTFAFRIDVDIPVAKVMDYYNAMQCPVCGSKQLKKQTNL